MAAAAQLYRELEPPRRQYVDRKFQGSEEEFHQALAVSKTVYVGNLSFYTNETQLYEVFSKVGEPKRIIMGLDRERRTPCGFCFIAYYTREDAEDSVKYLSGTIVDERSIRVDIDWGFVEGRQYGRGRSGGQVRDEYRLDFDSGRGGYGKIVHTELEKMGGMKRKGRDDDDGDEGGDGMDVDEGPGKKVKTEEE